MAKQEKPVEAQRRVWRMTQTSPLGEIVDAKPPAPPAKVVEKPPERLDEKPDSKDDPHWRASSFDLLRGLEVHDDSDTIPGDLFDELFKK